MEVASAAVGQIRQLLKHLGRMRRIDRATETLEKSDAHDEDLRFRRLGNIFREIRSEQRRNKRGVKRKLFATERTIVYALPEPLRFFRFTCGRIVQRLCLSTFVAFDRYSLGEPKSQYAGSLSAEL